MKTSLVVLEYLRLFFSWPVIVGTCVVFITLRFKAAIDSFVRNIALRTPGGFVLWAQQQQHVMRMGPEESRKAIEGLIQQATFWEYSYWSLHLVPKTQAVLRWLAKQPGVAYQGFCSQWPLWAFGPHSEREAVLNALRVSGMLQDPEGFLRVTAKGNEFLRFLDAMAPAAYVQSPAVNAGGE